jgi:hypothetical protein
MRISTPATLEGTAMQRADLVAIANAAAALKRIEELNKQFVQHAAAHATPLGLPTALQVSAEDFAIECFGYRAVAKPRPVRVDGNTFYMEYVFTIALGDEQYEVSRFYLTDNGHLLDQPSSQRSVCDYNNRYIAEHLCGRALLGTLASPLFAPRQVRG